MLSEQNKGFSLEDQVVQILFGVQRGGARLRPTAAKIIDLIREEGRAESRERVEALTEYAKAGADDYDGMCAVLRSEGFSDILPKAIQDMAESASLLRRAAAGDDVFAEYQAEITKTKAASQQREAILRERMEALLKGLREIQDIEPASYAYPEGWQRQIDNCEECKSYADHPVQHGICNTHRQPIWNRERHDKDEERRMGWRAKSMARALLAPPQADRDGEGA